MAASDATDRDHAVDCFITPNGTSPARELPVSYLHRSVSDRQRLASPVTGKQLVAEMLAAGVGRAIVDVNHSFLEGEAARAIMWQMVAEYPGRFIPAMSIDPREGMAALRKLSLEVSRHGVQTIRLEPWRAECPPSDPVYYPVYARSAELSVVAQISVGFPGIRRPAWVHDPLHVDQVCCDFPELKVLMTHVGEPWIGIVLKMLQRWDNLYLTTCSVAPKYYPAELVAYMNEAGADKVLFSSGYPFLSFGRCIEEILRLPLHEDVRRKFLRDNALRLFAWPDLSAVENVTHTPEAASTRSGGRATARFPVTKSLGGSRGASWNAD